VTVEGGPGWTVDRGRLDPEDALAVHALVRSVELVDGTPPVSERVLLHLAYGGDAEVRNLLVRDDSRQVLGYAHLDVTDAAAGSSAELAVAPAARGRGMGRALVEELVRQSPDGRLRLWAHGDLPGAALLADRLGFTRSRVLLQMRRPLTGQVADPLRAPVLPTGVTVRAFRPGQDEQAWTELNNRAFADHPDQGGWGLHEVELREKEPWFDPAGFFLAEREVSGRPTLVGFHWTKVHGGDVAHRHPETAGSVAEHPQDRRHPDQQDADDAHPERRHHDHPPIGEVYIVGIDPSEQGRGLGSALTLIGLHSLRDRGLDEVLLYVDETNVAAVRTYERLGFARHSIDVMYTRG
jgi:mycothiol synthase